MAETNLMREQSMTYADAGVDSAQIIMAHKILARKLQTTFQTRKGKFGEPTTDIGHYAGMIEIGDSRLLGLHVDGVGSKAMIAQMMKKYDTIGIDCVAMCVNDLICTGCEPTSFLDYIAVSKLDTKTIEQIADGLAKGAQEAGVAVVGGETAVTPDMLSMEEGGGLDLIGMAIGTCSKNDLILGNGVKEGDALIGLSSSGIHANGVTLARKALLRKYRLGEFIPELGRSLGEELLEPTTIYVKAVLAVLKQVEIHGLAHITSRSFTKIRRVVSHANLGAMIDRWANVPRIFELIKREGNVSDLEMFRTFNMGVGFVVICPDKEAEKAIEIFRKFKHKAFRIGKVTKKKGIWFDGLRLDTEPDEL